MTDKIYEYIDVIVLFSFMQIAFTDFYLDKKNF